MGKSNIKSRIVIISVVVVTLVIIGTLLFFSRKYSNYDRIFPNVYCGVLNLGGMTQEEAETAIATAYSAPTCSVTVLMPNGSTAVIAPPMQITEIHAHEAAEEAYQIGRDVSSWLWFLSYQQAGWLEHSVELHVNMNYDKADVRSAVSEIAQNYRTPAKLGSWELSPETHSIIITGNSAGSIIDEDTLFESVTREFNNGTLGDVIASQTMTAPTDEVIASYVEGIARECNVDPNPTTVTVDGDTLTIVKGSSGFKVDENKLTQNIKSAYINGDYETITYIMATEKPEPADVEALCQGTGLDPAAIQEQLDSMVDGQTLVYQGKNWNGEDQIKPPSNDTNTIN